MYPVKVNLRLIKHFFLLINIILIDTFDILSFVSLICKWGFNNSLVFQNYVCIPEIFNMDIPHQLFVYKITFVKSQRKNTNSKGDFVLKNQFKSSF